MFIFFRRNRKAQSTLEYAVLIGVVAAGLMMMKQYLQRGYGGKLREGADGLGNQFVASKDGGTTTNQSSNSTTYSREITEGSLSGSASFTNSNHTASENGVGFN